MSQTPAVSVVVPLYNKLPYILRCLDSIQRQTFRDFEVIVVNDGSTDGSEMIASALMDSRVTVVTQDNRGSGAARNRGIARAKAELIAFLDADDTWEEGFLQAIVDLASKHPEAGVFATGYRRCFGTGIDKEVTLRAPEGSRTCVVTKYLPIKRYGGGITSSSVAVRRALLTRLGGFLEGHPLGEDHDLWVRLSLYSPIVFDTRILAVYHSEADGRVCRVLEHEVHPPPPAVSSLRLLLSEGAVPDAVRRNVEFHIEWLLFNHIVTMLYTTRRAEITALLRSERFRVLRFRLGARLIQFALSFLPSRLMAGVRLKAATALWAIRKTPLLGKFVSLAEVFAGRPVLIRLVRTPEEPVRALAKAPSEDAALTR